MGANPNLGTGANPSKSPLAVQPLVNKKKGKKSESYSSGVGVADLGAEVAGLAVGGGTAAEKDVKGKDKDEKAVFFHPGCAFARNKKPHTKAPYAKKKCGACKGYFNHCHGAFGYRSAHGSGTWYEGPCPSDLSYWPESPNNGFCTKACQSFQSKNVWESPLMGGGGGGLQAKGVVGSSISTYFNSSGYKCTTKSCGHECCPSSIALCCSCSDKRPLQQEGTYAEYKDGYGWQLTGSRNAGYCPVCREKSVHP